MTTDRPDASSSGILNDPQQMAVHEAGHAVIGRVVGMVCGPVTIDADHDSAGHSMTAGPYEVSAYWESHRGRFREMRTVYRGRIITYMAGAEAEIALLGAVDAESEGGGGDEGDREQIDMMLDEAEAPGGNVVKLEARLRRATRLLCHRHRDKIKAVATALLDRRTLQDEEIRQLADLPLPADVDYWGERVGEAIVVA